MIMMMMMTTMMMITKMMIMMMRGRSRREIEKCSKGWMKRRQK